MEPVWEEGTPPLTLGSSRYGLGVRRKAPSVHAQLALDRSTSATAVSLPVSLASACRDENRFEFFFAALPWRMKGVTLSASNPVAVF